MAANLEHILHQTGSFRAPEALRAQANLQDVAGEHRRSLEDPDHFWGEWAGRFHWFSPWKRVSERDFPEHRWFTGAQVNITHNALDRHADGANRNRVALLWLGARASRSTTRATRCPRARVACSRCGGPSRT